MSVTLINSHMAAAAVAAVSDDYTTARRNAQAALAYMAALPDSEKGDESLSWDNDKITAFLDRMTAGEGAAVAAAAGGMQRSKISWRPPGARGVA